MPPKLRSFVAVDIPESNARAVAALADTLRLQSARSVSPKLLHITMVFLGDLDDFQLSAVKSAITNMTMAKFDVSLKGISTFSQRPRVVFADVEKGSQELIMLHNKLAEQLKGVVPMEQEHTFTPHATMMRVNGRKADFHAINSFVKQHASDSFGSFVCSDIRLKSSLRSDGERRYEDLYTVALL